MTVTIKDIAKIANVSYATVSRTLTGNREVSESTRRKILEICKKAGYSPQAIARGLITDSMNTLGVMVPDITNPFYTEVALGIEDEARRKGYGVLLCNTNNELEREESYFKLLLERRVEGIIIAAISDEAGNLFNRYQHEIPVVYVGSNHKNGHSNFAASDNEKAGFLAAEHLLQLGHKKIAFLGGTKVSHSHLSRIEGFKKAMRAYGMEPDLEWVREWDFKKEGGYRLTKLLAKENKFPTAIIAANDLVALGVIEACGELGLSVPEEVSVIGFDDIPYAALPKIGLTTVAQPKYKLGKLAVELVFRLLNNENRIKMPCEVVEPELVTRSTCGRRGGSESSIPG